MDSQKTDSPMTPSWVTPLYIRIGYGSSEKVEDPQMPFTTWQSDGPQSEASVTIWPG